MVARVFGEKGRLMMSSMKAARTVAVCVTLALMLAIWPAASAVAETTYTVQPGDTMWEIAANYGVSVDAVASVNGISDPGLIYVGQRLSIPGGESSSANPGSATVPTPAGAAGGVYVVQPGDTLSWIAANEGVTVAALIGANDIADPSLIYVGQRLTIPGASSGNTNTGTPPVNVIPTPPAATATPVSAGPGSILANKRIVTYYGNPRAAAMGVLGRYDPETVVTKLKEQTAEYAALSDKPVQGALHFIATVAQASPGSDGLYTAYMPMPLIEEWADLARAHGLLFFVDLQVGRSTVQEQVSAMLPILERPDVHLALDPEFDMWGSQVPGQQIGHMTADEINWATRTLSQLVASKGLPNKILIVHQFTEDMIVGKTSIATDPNVDIVIDMDGFGGQYAKISKYEYIQSVPVQFAGIKLFYREDTDLLSPERVMSLDPVPDVIIYQ